ncbi:MAG: DUF3987 domain-containing protein [Pseudoxanthomonas sp.]
MNALLRESPTDAARRFAGEAIRRGFQEIALHEYSDAQGEPQFWRIRLKHPNGEKWMRPMRPDGLGFAIGEPKAPARGKTLYRLRELMANPSAPVMIVEGEACADALARLGVTATTSGSSTSADAADWSVLRGRNVLLWPDHDVAGSKYASAIAELLQGIGCVVERIQVEALKLLEKGDVVDWLALHPDATADDVLNLPRERVIQAFTKPHETSSGGIFASAPELLRRPLLPAEPYPLDALGDVLGEAAKSIHKVVQAPAGLCGQSILAAASLAAQAHADVLVDGRYEPLSLWHMTVGESGERKSAADRWALQAHREHERTQADDYRSAMAAYELEATSRKAATRQTEGKKDVDRARASVAANGTPADAPLAPWLLLPEATLEGLHKLYQHGRPSLGLFNDDAGDFLDGHAMSRENRTKSAAGFSKLWDSGEFSRIRAGDGAAKFYGRRLAMHVMVQPIIAERLLSDDMLCGQGFLPRCLVAWPTSMVGSRQYVDTDLSEDPGLARYWSRMARLLCLAPILRPNTRNELEPRALRLAPDAKARWVKIANGIESDMAGEFASIKAWASKGAAQILRIAGVLTLVEEPESDIILLGALDRAALLALHHLREAARVVGAASMSAKVKHAELLRAWCWETGRTLLHSTIALNSGPNPIRTNDLFTAAVETLEAAGWLEYVDGGMVLDGKHRTRVWRVRPQEAT